MGEPVEQVKRAAVLRKEATKCHVSDEGTSHGDADNDIPHAVPTVTLGAELAHKLVEPSDLSPSPSPHAGVPFPCSSSPPPPPSSSSFLPGTSPGLQNENPSFGKHSGRLSQGDTQT